MGKLISYLGSSKILKKIADFLNVTDVKVNGTSVVDANGVADIDLSLYVGIKVVQTLPQTGVANFIYLVPSSDPGTENIYDEYVWTENGWELIGSTEIDLSDYYTKTESDNRYVQPGDLAAVATSGDYDDLIDKPTIPDELSDLADDSTHRLVTDTEKSTWNGKADMSDIPTDFVPKSTGGTFNGDIRVEESNTSGSSSVLSQIVLGNNKSVGTPENSRGRVAIYGYGDKFFSFEEKQNSPLSSSVNLYPPSSSGTLALEDATAVYKELSNEDLNTVKTVGFYVGKSGNSCTNKPANVTGQFGLIVIKTATSQNNYYKQICIAPTGELYQRRQYQASPGWNSWEIILTTDQNVTQEYTQTTSGDYLLLASNSNKDSSSDETGIIKKIAHAYITGSTGNITFCRKHSNTAVQNHIVVVGNNIADGNQDGGAVDGVLRLFGKGAYYSQFYDGFNSLTANQTYRPRDLTGTMALLPDIADSCIQIMNGEFNYINPPYYHANGTNSSGIAYSTNENTGEYTVEGTASSAFNANIKRWSQGLYLKAGKYKLSGLPSNTGCQLRVYSATTSGSTTFIGSDTGSGFEFSLTERTLMHIVLVIPTNSVIDFTFRPKIKRLSEWVELGSISASSTNFATSNYKELKAVFEISYSSYKKYVTVFCDYEKISGSEAYFSNGFDLSGEVSVIAKLVLGTPNFSVKTGAILPTGTNISSTTLYAKA